MSDRLAVFQQALSALEDRVSAIVANKQPALAPTALSVDVAAPAADVAPTPPFSDVEVDTLILRVQAMNDALDGR